MWLIVFFSFSSLYSQIDKLTQMKQRLEKKVSVGSTTEEVKKILGKPKSVEGGFPNSDEMILKYLPEQVGQLNNSTWFYFFHAFKITYETQDKILYYLNGQEISQSLFFDYYKRDSIYFYNGEPISVVLAERFKNLRDISLKLIPKKQNKCFYKKLNPHIETALYIPILCVIFDRGTQVVASTRVYFELVD